MIGYIVTALVAGLAGLLIGFLVCGLLTSGSDADEWSAGYLAGRRDQKQSQEEAS